MVLDDSMFQVPDDYVRVLDDSLQVLDDNLWSLDLFTYIKVAENESIVIFFV